MEIEEAILIEQYRSLSTNEIGNFAWSGIPLLERYKYFSVTLCIIYPKGKRPDLGYPVNNKIEEK